MILARVIQGVAGGIFPLAFSIARDEFPPDKVAGSIGLMSSILGVGSGLGLIIGALVIEHLGWHWLFWLPLVVTLLAAFFTRRYIPESPVRSPGKVNWLAAALMSARDLLDPDRDRANHSLGVGAASERSACS